MSDSTSAFTSTYESLPGSIKELIILIVKEIDPDEIILFGSRARGDNRDNSDFDIAVRTSSVSEISKTQWAKIRLALEEDPITLYPVDLLDVNHLEDDYKKRICMEGKPLYVRR